MGSVDRGDQNSKASLSYIEDWRPGDPVKRKYGREKEKEDRREGGMKRRNKFQVVAHPYNLRRLRQENPEFKGQLGALKQGPASR